MHSGEPSHPSAGWACEPQDARRHRLCLGLHLVMFPPHCTHRLQPLDRTLFRCLKTSYCRACDSWLLANRGQAITHHDVMPMFRQAYVNSATMQATVNGFTVSGIRPVNNDKFNDELNALETATLVQPAVRDEHDAAIQPAVRNEHVAAIPSTSTANVLTSSPYK